MKGNRLAALAGPAAHDRLWEGFEEQRDVGTGNIRKKIKGEMTSGSQVGSGSPARKEFGLYGDVKTFQPDTGSTTVWLGSTQLSAWQPARAIAKVNAGTNLHQREGAAQGP